jgi:hypothetical protein
VIPPETLAEIEAALEKRASIFTDSGYVGYFRTENGSVNILHLHGCRALERSRRTSSGRSPPTSRSRTTGSS